MTEYIYGDIEYMRNTGEPCPVCGAPNSGCAPEGHVAPRKLFGIGLFPSLDAEQTYEVIQDFYVTEYVTADREVPVLKFRKGQVISLLDARKFNLTTN
jgi:hypothetical protein